MVLLGAGTTALLFVVAAELAGVLAGLVAAVSFTAAPFVLTLVPRAHTEAPFLFFLILGLWLSIRAARAAVGVTGAASDAPTGRGVACGARTAEDGPTRRIEDRSSRGGMLT